MPKIYIKRVPSSEWSNSVWDSATSYNVGDRITYDDGAYKKLYTCIQSHSSSIPQTNGDAYWARIGSKEYPYYAGDGRLDSHTLGEVYLESINGRYLGSGGAVWAHATEDGTVPGEIILEDGEYFQPTSALCVDGLDYTALNTGQVTITHFYFNYHYIHYGNSLTTHRSEITGINLIMGGGSSIKLIESNSKIFFKQCKLTDEDCPYGPANGNDFRIGNANHTSFKDTLLYFPNATAPLFGNGTTLHEGERPIWENTTFALGFGSGNNYSPLFYGSSNLSKSPYVKSCIFYATHLGYTSTGPINITHSNNIGESNILYSASDANTFTEVTDDFQYLDPGFVDSSKGNFSLRPSSPLIGGIKDESSLSKKYPDGVWVDHNHTPVQASHTFSLDSGNGTNYTFSGDETGSDPTLNVNIQDTLTFANNTGGHPLAIYNSQGLEVASESGGTTTFTPKYADTYYYQCTVSGHQNMRGDIVVSQGTLGSYNNPFESYHDAIDAGYFDSKLTLLFKEGDHLMSWYPGTGYSTSTGISSAFSGGLYFIGENHNSRLTTGNNFNSYSAFYVGTSLFTGGPQSQTPLNLENITIHINNTSSYLNRGLFSGAHWKSFSAKSVNITAELGAGINSSVFDYFTSHLPDGYSFKLSGCQFNVPLSDNNGPGGAFLNGTSKIAYDVQSCTFCKLSGYNYVHSGPSPLMVGGAFSVNNGSSIKNCIFYSNVGGDFYSNNPSTGVFSSCIFYSTTDSFTRLPADMDLNSTADPSFVQTIAGSEDLRLRADSPAIGGLTAEPTNVYYLQPGNAYNGDGSQKDASSMSAHGDAGPFNEFKEIVNAGVPYGSTIIIINGTYDWTTSFGRSPSSNVSSNVWYAYTCAGYNYIAETINEVIFDAKLDPSNIFAYKPYGGTVPGPSIGAFLDLDTTFTGIQFNNMIGADNATRNMITSVSGSAGLGSCTFKNCKFLGHINTASSTTYPWTGGGRNIYSSTMHWENCEISIAFDHAGGLLCGGDSFADDQYHGAWSWKNCTFYIPAGITTFNGRNAANGTYVSPSLIFGTNYSQNQRIFQNNIIHIPNGAASIGTNNSSKLPNIKNNCFNGVSPVYSSHDHTEILNSKNNLFGVDPKFVDPDSNKFNLRPTSTLIGKGL
jgi:plastocyanin